MKQINLENIISKINNIKTDKELEKFSKSITEINIFYTNNDTICNTKILIKNFLCKLLIKKANILSKDQTKISLNKILSKHLLNGKHLIKIIKYNTKYIRNIGKIPNIFLSKTVNKKDTAIKIYDLFSEYSLKLNYFYEKENKDKNNITKPEIKTFEKELSQLINKNAKIKYIGCGYNGNTFKITINKRHFLYKVFFPYNSDDYIRYCNHGTFAEPQMALFTSHNASKNRFAKFYFGRVGYSFYTDTFIVTEYLSGNKKTYNKKNINYDYIDINENELLKYDNTINGKIVDFGGLKISIQELQDKHLRKIVNVIANHIKYKYEEKKLTHYWEINNKSLTELKLYLSQYNIEDIKKAFDILKKYNINFPNIFKELNNNTKSVNIVETLNSKDIFQNNIIDTKRNAENFNLHIKAEMKPITFLNELGYLIIELSPNTQCIIFYDNNNITQKLRIEQILNTEVISLFELKTNKEIQSFEAMDFYKIINNYN